MRRLAAPWQVWIGDATGKLSRCRMLLARDAFRAYANDLPRQTRRRLLSRLQRAIVVPWAAATAPYCLAVLLFVMEEPFAVPVVARVPLLAVAVGVYLTVGTRPMRRAYQRAHVSILLEHQRCPWCLYDLTGAPVEADSGGTALCPECGAVWAGMDTKPRE